MSLDHDIYQITFNAYGLPFPVREHKFHPLRKWRIDYVWPDVRLAVELEGGIFSRGRHVRGSGFKADMEKYNAMAEAGWVLLRYEPDLKKINYQQILNVYKKISGCL